MTKVIIASTHRKIREAARAADAKTAAGELTEPVDIEKIFRGVVEE